MPQKDQDVPMVDRAYAASPGRPDGDGGVAGGR